jgi:NAD(P)H-dependent FMN reductase
MKILAIPGSLRSDSSSSQILRNIHALLPANVRFEVYNGVGTLPHFNDAATPSAPVVEFRSKIKEADGVIICTPEYAFGIPGALKNALDWTVGSAEFIDKPVALITASSQGEKGHAAMLLVLQAISAKVIAESSMVISFVRAKLDEQGNVKDLQTLDALKTAMKNFTKHL